MKPIKRLIYTQAIPPFNQWINELREDELNPRKYGFSFTDIDGVFFRLEKNDDVSVALLEVKIYGKRSTQNVSTVNKKLFSALNSVMTACDGRFYRYTLDGENIPFCFNYLGMHVLKMSDTRPDDSEWMTWDGHYIDQDTLVRILRMELNPHFPFELLEKAA